MLDDRPTLSEAGAPLPEDVRAAQNLVREVGLISVGRGAEDNAVVLSADESNGILRLVCRVIPGLRARSEVTGGQVILQAAFPLQLPGGVKWLNIEARAPEFEGRAVLGHLAVGGLSLPPDLFVATGRIGANLLLGNSAGDTILASAARLKIIDRQMHFTLRIDEDRKRGAMVGFFGVLRGGGMPSAEEIDHYYVEIRQAIDAGLLPQEGSFLPYLRFVVDRVIDTSEEQTFASQYTAAIFGLTRACGLENLPMIARAGTGQDSTGNWSGSCHRVTLNGRTDTRLHFLVAAAIQAASNRGLSVSLGEFKELSDLLSAKNGFDFTDIAANNSGIRFSNRLMTTPFAELAGVLERMQIEHDVIVHFDPLPELLPREEFERQFVNINSPQYQNTLASIEEQIDDLAIHAIP